MITRLVPRCSGSGAAACAVDSTEGGHMTTPSRPPADVLRQAHAASLAGILSQIGAFGLLPVLLFHSLCCR